MKSIGIYPGSFDPVHKGHVSFAEKTFATCRLDVLYFLPENSPRGKTNVSDIRDRSDAIRNEIVNTLGLDVINLESDQFSIPSTMPEIEDTFGRAEYTLLVGSDVARTLEAWPECETLLRTWSIAIGMRNDDKADEIERMFERLEASYDISIRRTYIRAAHSDVSSSSLRMSK